MIKEVFSVSTNTLLLSLLSLLSGELQTRHSQAMMGIPCEVPVPKNVTFNSHKVITDYLFSASAIRCNEELGIKVSKSLLKFWV